ncbi:pentatricopeptide repeat-containing protein At1g77360, mitochondrial [Silene latifolia]|uniref:pentatricopeptide repeat-containing protein At1g77360, mitochondrial n=1 Tax=Silene latifolia TaxID=37657 RepID=UPI003D77A74B
MLLRTYRLMWIKEMSRVQFQFKKVSSAYAFVTRPYSSDVDVKDLADMAYKQICRIMMSCPKVGLDVKLDHSGVRVTPDIVEKVLTRFQNAGMISYCFFEWAGKQQKYEHSVEAYHTMIESLAKIRQFEIMWNLVNNMRSKRILNVETFCTIIRRYARMQKVDEALYSFNVMEKYGIYPNLAAFNGLLSALCKSKNVRKAQELFDKMKDRFEPDSKTYSILLEGWGREPNLPKARETFRQMVHVGCNPDIVTYGIMVDVLCKTGRVDEAVGVVRSMEAEGCRPTSFIYSILVHTYGVEHRIEDAIDTFLEMAKDGVEADVVVYNALIGAFCKLNKFKNVFRVLKEMDDKGVTPNARTCNIILNSLIAQEETDEAFRVFRRMIRVCDPDADTYTIMVKMFFDRDDPDNALKVWKYMKSKKFVPSMHTYSVLINGLCKLDRVSDACVYMEEMIEKGMQPPVLTFRKLRQLLLKEERHDVLKFLQEKMNLLVKEPLSI